MTPTILTKERVDAIAGITNTKFIDANFVTDAIDMAIELSELRALVAQGVDRQIHVPQRIVLRYTAYRKEVE